MVKSRSLISKIKLPRTEVVNLEKIRIKWSGKGLIPWENKF